MEPNDKTALCTEGGFIVGRVSSLYDSSYLEMHDKGGGECPVADGRGKVYNERGKSRT